MAKELVPRRHRVCGHGDFDQGNVDVEDVRLLEDAIACAVEMRATLVCETSCSRADVPRGDCECEACAVARPFDAALAKLRTR